MSAQELTSRNWFGRASAGLVAGFMLALGITSILGWIWSDKGSPLFSAQGQIAMWLMSPIWTLLLGFCFFFTTGLRAWGWLGLANLIVWGAYAALRLTA